MHGHRANGGPYGSSFLAQDSANNLEKNLAEVRLPLNSPTFAFVATFAFAAAALRRLCAFVSANANVAAGVSAAKEKEILPRRIAPIQLRLNLTLRCRRRRITEIALRRISP